jgi:F-type H+-transporting ATPase subunit beta
MATATAQQVGRIVQIIGPVVDVEFEAGHLPAIYNALRIHGEAKDGREAIDVIVEVEQHLPGENRVRTVAMKPTDGMQRGMKSSTWASRSRCRSDPKRSAAC